MAIKSVTRNKRENIFRREKLHVLHPPYCISPVWGTHVVFTEQRSRASDDGAAGRGGVFFRIIEELLLVGDRLDE